MEVLTLLIGLAIGYYINHSRIEESKASHRERISEYKDAFAKGFQTKHGYEPYVTEKKEEATVHDPYETYEGYETQTEGEPFERWHNA